MPRTSRRRRARSRAPLRLVLIFYIVCLTKPISIQFRPFWVQAKPRQERQEVHYLAYLVAAGTCLRHAWDRHGAFSSSQGYCLSCFCAVSHIMSCPALFLLCFALLSGLVPFLTYFVFLCFAVSDSLLAPKGTMGRPAGGRAGAGSHLCHVSFTWITRDHHITVTSPLMMAFKRLSRSSSSFRVLMCSSFLMRNLLCSDGTVNLGCDQSQSAPRGQNPTMYRGQYTFLMCFLVHCGPSGQKPML